LTFLKTLKVKKNFVGMAGIKPAPQGAALLQSVLTNQ